MATPDTQLIISIETVLKNLDRTLKGLSRVEKQLRAIAAIGPSRGSGFDKTAAAAERLRIKQDRLVVQSQELTNRQERARQSTERLALSQQRLEQAQTRVARATATAGQQMDAHVRVFRSAQEQSRALNRQLNATGNALRSVGQGFASFGFTLAATLTAPLAAFGVVATRSAVSMDSLRRGLTAIVGSSEEASRQLARLTEIAKLPGIGFEEAIQGSIRLQAVGFSAAEAEAALVQFSNAIALTGGGREELARVTVQLGQLAAKGKVLAQDLKPIIEAAPAVGRALLQAFGTVNSEDIQELGLSSREFLDILVKQLGQLPRAAAGARNAFENFRDTVFRAAATVGEALLPILTRLIDVAAPIITALAEGFKSLPVPLQVVVVVIGGLVAVLGPTLIIVGQLTLGIGRLMVGFAQLNTQGIAPATLSLRTFQGALTSVTASTRAATVALASSTKVWGALGIALGLAAIAIDQYGQEEKKATAVDTAAAKSRLDRLKATKDEVKFLEGLTEQTSLNADQQRRLTELYESLTGAAKGRVALLQTEQEKVKALTEALKEQVRLDQFAAQAASAQLVTNAIIAIENRAKAQGKYNKAQEEFNRLLALEHQGLSVISADGNRIIKTLDRQKEVSLEAAAALEEISKTEGDIEAAANTILELGRATGISTNSILEQARAAGVNKARIDEVQQAIDKLVDSQKDAVPAVDELTKAILAQNKALEESLSKDPSVVIAKSSEKALRAVLDFLRETANSTKDAENGLRNYIELFPQLKKAVERAGGVEEIIRSLLEPKGRKHGTELRNAQEALASALAELAQASADELTSIEKIKNERLLQENESNFRLQIVSYRQYLDERLRLTVSNLRLELREQEKVAENALAEQARFVARAKKAGIPVPERVRAEAGAVEAEEKLIKAGTRIKELQGQIKRAVDERDQALAEAARRQLSDTRQLEIEYAQLQGRIQAALDTETVERFRERLQELSNTQAEISVKLERAQHARDVEQVAELKLAQQRNQRELEAIENQVRLRQGLAELAAAEQLVTNAKEKQRLLEERINFDVQFRGLAEEEAIRRRLEGERRLQQSLELSRSIIRDTIRQLTDLGITPPPELQKFVENLAKEIQGLGELPFSEQFRLAEKEFNRLNDERLRRIADVERAVRKRDIAEVEGRLLIKKINGEYVADLEAQLAVLKRIAELSGQEGLKRQAADTAETVKDARDQIVDFDKQLRATAIDSFRDSFVQFFRDLRDNTENAAQDFLNFLDRIGQRITDLIAENLADKLIESILGVGDEKGILAQVRGIFGGGIQQQVGAAGAGAATGAAIAGAATTAGAAMATGGATAGAALEVGGVAAATTLATSVTTAAAAFSAAVVAAGAAFAAAVTAAAGSQAAVGLSQLPFAAGDFLKPQRGGVLARIAEGGHSEAVLTTDPRHAARQAQILMRYLKETRGLFGRFKIPELAEGAFLTPRQAEVSLLNSIERNPVSLSRVPETALGRPDNRPSLSLRNINLFDRKAIAHDYLRSAEGARDILNIVSENGDEIGRRLGLK